MNGEEILGEFVSEDGYFLKIKSPLKVETIDDGTNVTKLILVTFMPFADVTDGMSFMKGNLIQYAPVKPNVSKYYENFLKYIQKNIDTGLDEKLDKTNENIEESLENDSYNPLFFKNISKSIH
jgi:hypothetical protein